MTAQFLTLEIDGVPVPAEAMDGLQVVYEDLEPHTDRRAAGGAFNRRVFGAAVKLRATISGLGFCPPGLDALSLTALYTVALPKQRELTSASPVITLPAARRAGALYAPQGFAIVGGLLVATGFDSIAGDIYTCTAVSGASGYRVDYFPQISAYVARGDQQLDAKQRRHRWQLVVEEG